MASTYNSRLLVPEVLVNGDRYAVVRPRQTYEELLGLDRVPDWLAGEGDPISLAETEATPRQAAGA
jgi:hypothetical protein